MKGTSDGGTHSVLAAVQVHLEPARTMLERAFRAVRVGSDEAYRITDALIEAELNEVVTHGLMRAAGYLRGFATGAFNPCPNIHIQEMTPVATLVDGDRALGYLPSWLAMEAATKHAHEYGIGLGGVRNTGEFGRAAYYAQAAADQGYVAIVCQNTPPLVAAPGSCRATNGNSPVAFAAPYPDAPVFDGSFTPHASGALRRLAMLGLPLDDEWACTDVNGELIRDPAVAYQAVVEDQHPLPVVGGAKGFGIVLLVELLAGVLTGAVTGPMVRFRVPEVGVAVLVIDPNIFGAGLAAAEKFSATAEAVRRSGGRLPGDRAREARQRNVDRGYVEVPKVLIAELDSAIRELCPGVRVDVG